MSLNLTNININFRDGQINRVDVYFNVRDEQRRDYLNGNVEISPQEYFENISDITGVVRDRIVALVQEEEPQEEGGETAQTAGTMSMASSQSIPVPESVDGSDVNRTQTQDTSGNTGGQAVNKSNNRRNK